MKTSKTKSSKNNISAKTIIIVASAIILIVLAVAMATGNKDSSTDLVINKSDISSTVKFYPVKVSGQKMEILAVKASDGTIRTAFNTCQVCNGSPLAYYKQEGDVIVCQNCGNRFSMDMIEKQRNGCNPIPITSGNKIDDGDKITISYSFIEANKGLFKENWKTR